MSALTLYEISSDLVALLDSFDMCETDEQRTECAAEIEKAMDAQVRKVDSFCAYLTHLEALDKLAGEEIERLRERRSTIGNRIDRLKAYAVSVMQSAGLTKLEGVTNTLSVRMAAPAVDVLDEEAIPAKFKTVKQTVSVDKRAVKRALDAGEDVPGADLRFGAPYLVRK